MPLLMCREMKEAGRTRKRILFLVDSFADSNRDGFWRISTEYVDVELT